MVGAVIDERDGLKNNSLEKYQDNAAAAEPPAAADERHFGESPPPGPVEDAVADDGAAEESTDEGDDMEVDEINRNVSQDSAESSINHSHRDLKKTKPAIAPKHARMELRASKRQRSNLPLHRYSPGEGGGLASKKPKAGGSCDGDGLSSSTCFSSLGDGNGRGRGDKKKRGGGREGPSDPLESRPEPTYRWIDEGSRSGGLPSVLEHAGVEIDFTKTKTADWTPPPPFAVRVGDAVLLSSDGSAPWDVADDRNGDSRGKGGGPRGKRCEQPTPLYNDPASREGGLLGALDPYIGLVERLWEEPDGSAGPSGMGSSGRGKKRGRGPGATSRPPTGPSRMMVRTRWFFKKEDVEGLRGSLVVDEGGDCNGRGKSREKILATMNPQDLVLTDRADDNAISTVLGKIQVERRRPLDGNDRPPSSQAASGGAAAHTCRYNLSFCPVGTSSGGKGRIVARLSPCADDARGDVRSTAAKETGALNRGGVSKERPPAPLAAPLSSPLSPRRAALSEGATTVGRIEVGPNHQAVIPVQLDLARKTSFRGMTNPPSQRVPIMVWDPANDRDDGTVDGFLEDARALLLGHLKAAGVEPFLDTNYVECPDPKSEAAKPREIDIDRLLSELHECKGNVGRAIKKVSNNPGKYMTIWTREDRDGFDVGYRTYRESIRMVAISLGKSKTCKDTVDYQYRFKLVENFRRFQRKKREKAEEIMATVEDRMLNEKAKAEEKRKGRAGPTTNEGTVGADTSSSEEAGGEAVLTASGSIVDNDGGGSCLAAVPAGRGPGPANGRIRTWFRTGGQGLGAENDEEVVVGATQRRRNQARDILAQVRERAGDDAYITLARGILACNDLAATDRSLLEVRSAATEVMRGHPDLLKRFVAFLPKEIRSA